MVVELSGYDSRGIQNIRDIIHGSEIFVDECVIPSLSLSLSPYLRVCAWHFCFVLFYFI